MLNSACLGFRSATEAEIDWLFELRMQTMASHLETSGANLTSQDQLERVLQDFSLIQIVTRRGSDVGMLKVDQSSDPWVLIQIQIDPMLQGQGIGARLIRDLQDQAASRGVGLELSVLKVNPAKTLYDRLGFRVIGETGYSYEMRYDA